MKYYLLRLFRLKSGAHQVALGLAIGFTPCWYPSFGIGPVISVLLAKIVKANIVAAFIAAMFGSFVWPMLFVLNYRVGKALLFFRSDNAPGDETAQSPTIEFDSIKAVGMEFLAGSVFNMTVFGVISYLIFFTIFKRYRLAILRKLSPNKETNA